LYEVHSCSVTFGTNCLTLFKGVAAVIFVGESDRCSFR